MLHMKDQCRIKNPGFQICIFLVRSEHVKNVFRRRTVGIRTVDIHTAIQIIMVIRMIPVNSQHREDTDKIHRLAENIFHGIIRNLIIVGGQRQHALRHGIHDILTGRLHNDISGKLPERTRIFRVPDCGNGNASARRKGRCRKIWSRLFPEARRKHIPREYLLPGTRFFRSIQKKGPVPSVPVFLLSPRLRLPCRVSIPPGPFSLPWSRLSHRTSLIFSAQRVLR